LIHFYKRQENAINTKKQGEIIYESEIFKY